MVRADFDRRMRDLSDQVGTGTLRGTVEFDQIYAAFQHERADFSHDTGKAFYLRDPLFAGVEGYMRSIARHVLDRGGPVRGMTDAAEDLADEAGRQAPKDLSNLSRSDHVAITDSGRKVYDRPPEVPRLTERELAELHGGRRGNRGPRIIDGAPGKLAIENPAWENKREVGRSDPAVPGARRRPGSARRGRGPTIT